MTLRIAHVIDYFHTDVGYQEFYLAQEQARAGHQVTVLASRHRHHTIAVPGEDEDRGEHELRQLGVDLHRLPARQLGHDRAWLHGLEGALRSRPVDVVHCHGPFAPTTVRVARACDRFEIPLLVDNHIQESGAPASTKPLGRAFYGGFRAAFGRSLRRSVQTWVADGPEKADFLSTRLGVPLQDIQLVPLGFDPSSFNFDADRRRELRQTRGWSDELVIAVTGKLHPGKRVEDVARAAERLGARLVVAGSFVEGYLEKVRAEAPKLDAGGRLTLLPLLSRDELADLYLASDAVVFARLPSISIFEALGSGARVIVGPDPFAAWLTQQFSALEVAGADGLTEVLERTRAQREDDERARRAQAAASTFGWPIISAQFLELYRVTK